MVANATVNTTLAVPGTSVLYRCVENHVFGNGETDVTVLCNAGDWSRTLEPCEGR